jgi:hypothetical protein
LFCDESGFRADTATGTPWAANGRFWFATYRARVRAEVQALRSKLTRHRWPGSAPALKPDEWVWSHVNRTATARTPPRAG